MKRCFYQMEDMVSGTCANQEAATLFSTSPELFKIKVEACLRQADIDAVAPPSRDYSIRCVGRCGICETRGIATAVEAAATTTTTATATATARATSQMYVRLPLSSCG